VYAVLGLVNCEDRSACRGERSSKQIATSELSQQKRLPSPFTPMTLLLQLNKAYLLRFLPDLIELYARSKGPCTFFGFSSSILALHEAVLANPYSICLHAL
jgi:hypothetical protein